MGIGGSRSADAVVDRHCDSGFGHADCANQRAAVRYFRQEPARGYQRRARRPWTGAGPCPRHKMPPSNLQAQAQSNPFMQPAPYRASPRVRYGVQTSPPTPAPFDVRSPRATTGPAATQPASFQAASEAAPMGQDAVANRDLKQQSPPIDANSTINRFDFGQPRFGNAIDTSISSPDQQLTAPSAAHPNELATAPVALPAAGTNAGDEKFRRAEMRLARTGRHPIHAGGVGSRQQPLPFRLPHGRWWQSECQSSVPGNKDRSVGCHARRACAGRTVALSTAALSQRPLTSAIVLNGRLVLIAAVAAGLLK